MSFESSFGGTNMNNGLDNALIENQQVMLEEFNRKSKVENIRYKPEATSFLIEGESFTLKDANCQYKKLIFSALYTKFYLHYVKGEGAKIDLPVIRQFISFLESASLDIGNKVSVLKDFEVHRVKINGVKTQSSGLARIKKYIKEALNYTVFCRDGLEQNGYIYLELLTFTKNAKKDPSEQETLSKWFGKHSWLRRGDVGIGNELYKRIASPKQIIKSLEITAVTALLEINQAKHQLIKLFDENRDFKVPMNDKKRPQLTDYEGGRKSQSFREEEAQYKTNEIKAKQSFLSSISNLVHAKEREEDFTLSYEAIAYSQCTLDTMCYVLEQLSKNEWVSGQRSRKTVFKQSSSYCQLFNQDFVESLVEYSHNKTSGISVPLSKAEVLLFSILMSIKTVPTDDLLRLKLSNFKFIKRQNGDYTHVKCNYFKTRAKSIKSTDTIRLNTDFGRAVFLYLKDKTGDLQLKNDFIIDEKLLGSKTGRLTAQSILFRFLAESSIRKEIDIKLEKEQVTPVFIEAMNKFCTHGVRNDKDLAKVSETVSEMRFFGASHIKNSSVHSNTDQFDPTSIINMRSHSNETERDSYLSEENEEWQNNTGRITRTIMNDIQINILRPSLSQRAKFSSEYLKASKFISQQAEELVCRLKLVTKKEALDLRVDDLGFVKYKKARDGDMSDSIYLVKSPETILKLKHFVAEVERTHARLFENAPEFLFNTALPAVEWIYSVLTNSYFSKEILKEGEDLYMKYSSNLPSLFHAQTGGLR